MAEAPNLFALKLHPEGLTDQDLESLRFFGVTTALVSPGHEPAPDAKAILEHWDQLLGSELKRLERAGIRAYVGLGVHPRSIPRRGLATVLAALPGYCRQGKVVAICEIGLEHREDASEEDAFHDQLELARSLNLPVVAYTPAKDKERVTRRVLSLLQESALPASRVMVDRAGGKTVRPILECGHYASLCLHPDELTAERAVALVRKLGGERLILGLDAGARAGDLLALPRAANLLERAKLSEPLIHNVTFDNARAFLRVGV